MVKVQDDGEKKGVTPTFPKGRTREGELGLYPGAEYCSWGILSDVQVVRQMKGDETSQANRDINVEVTRTCYKVHIFYPETIGSISGFCRGTSVEEDSQAAE